MREIEELVAIDGRWPGTDAERRAAGHLAGRLEEMGREVDVESTQVWPNYALTHVVHAMLGIVGSVLSVSAPLPGAALVLIAAVSTFGDLTGTFYLVRRLTGRRASQNVVSREDGGKPGTLILVAHYDAAHTGAVFGRRTSERRASLSKTIRRPIGAFEPFFWALMLALVCAILRLALPDSFVLTIFQFLAVVVLIVSVPLLADIAFADIVPGATDNASGVATVLRLAERYGGELDEFDVWVLLPGAEEALWLGMRSFLKEHKDDLSPARTIFLNVDMVGHGTVRYIQKEGLILSQSLHPSLLELCDEIAEEDEEEGRYGARGIASRIASDSYMARQAGFPTIGVRCLGALDYDPHHHLPSDVLGNVDPEALERGFGFCCELVELIDERIGPDVAQAEGKDESPLTEEDEA